MSIKSQLVGNGDKETVDIVKCPSRRLNTLVVSNIDLQNFSYVVKPFVNSTYGENMNQDFSGGVDSTENVHNGNDAVYWTGSIIIGHPSSIDFSDTAQSHSGAQSIGTSTKLSDGDVFQLLSATEISNTLYDRFSGWIYVDSGWIGSGDDVEFYLYNTTAGTKVSEKSVYLSEYIVGSNTGIWQVFNISMTSFGTISQDYDAIRFKVYADGDVPQFYLDDLKLEELSAGGVFEYTIHPPQPKWWYVDGLQFVMASTYTATAADSTMPKIPYSGILGSSLTNGITYQRKQDREVKLTALLNDFIDFLEQPGTEVVSNGYDGTYTWVIIRAVFDKYPLLLKSDYEDKLSFVISDDLSSLTRFRVFADIREIDTSKEFV